MVGPVLQNANTNETEQCQNESNGTSGEEIKVSAALLKSLIKRISTLEENMKIVKTKLGLEDLEDEKVEKIGETTLRSILNESVNGPGPSEVTISKKPEETVTAAKPNVGAAEVLKPEVKAEVKTPETNEKTEKVQKDDGKIKTELVKSEPQPSTAEKKDNKLTTTQTKPKEENKKLQQNKPDRMNRSFSNKRKNNQQRPIPPLNPKRPRNLSFNNRNQQNTSGNYNLFNNQPVQQRWEQNNFPPQQQPQPLLAFQRPPSTRFTTNLRQSLIPSSGFNNYPSNNLQQSNVWMRPRLSDPSYQGYLPQSQQNQSVNPFGPAQRTWR